MNTQRVLGMSKRMFHAGVLITTWLGSTSVFAQVHHPIAAHRIRVHRVQTHRENVAGAVQERRENVAGVRQERVENIAGRRATAAAARAILPRYSPATIAAFGSVVVPPPVTPVTIPATESSAKPADELEGLHSDVLPDMFEGSTSYLVLRIEDGGVTVVLKTEQGETKVRMIGVAAVALGERGQLPERFANLRLPSTETFVSNLLKGESVYVVYDTQVAEEDSDKKCVAYLFRAPDGLMVNLEVIRAGFAVTDTSYDFDQKPLFTKYQSSAQKAGKGIYGIVQRVKAVRGDK